MVEDINGAFDPLGQLWKLGLAHNRIKSVNKNAFTGLSSVTELDLSGNNVTSIQENAFVSMTSLTKLRMNTSKYECETRSFVIRFKSKRGTQSIHTQLSCFLYMHRSFSL